MTTSRDPEALLNAYLADGMSVLPDSVVDAVLDEVHRTRQRAVLGPRRTQPMFKIGLAAAAAVAIIIGGSALLGAFDAPPNPGAPSSTPAATTSAMLSPSGMPSPSAVTEPSHAFPSFPGTGPRVELAHGTTYVASQFSQPMTLTMPDVSAELGPDVVANGFTYGPEGNHTMQITYDPINIAMTIHDDFRIDTNLCKPDGQVQEVPATPEGVGEWLHDQLPTWVGERGSRGKVVADQPDMIVDGRVAKVYDIRTGTDCPSGSSPPVGDVSTYSNQWHRIYAIPTGSDTILVISWNQGGTLPRGTANEISDRLVASFTFN